MIKRKPRKAKYNDDLIKEFRQWFNTNNNNTQSDAVAKFNLTINQVRYLMVLIFK